MLAPKQFVRGSGRRPSSSTSDQEALFRALFENIPVGIAHSDLETGGWLRMNPALCEMLGYSSHELSLLTWRDITHGDDLAADLEQYQRLQSGEIDSYKLIKRYVHKSGRPVWARVSISLVNNTSDEPHVMAVVEDITTSVEHSNALQESEERYRQLVETSPDAILVIADHRSVYANKAAGDIFGTSPAKLGTVAISSLISPGCFDLVSEAIVACIDSGAPVDMEAGWLRTFEGEAIDASLQVSCGRVAYEGRPAVQVILRDITERINHEAALRHQATHDPLTGLLNRPVFLTTITGLLEDSETLPFSILLMDLDGFKEVNDTFGHHYGDLLLSALGSRLEEFVSAQEMTVARLGGDEFAFVVKDDDPVQVAQRLLELVGGGFQLDEHQVDLGGSIGIVRVPEHGRNANELLRRADVAMYLAKRNRAGCALYDVTKDNHSPEQLRLVSDLRLAIGTEQLMLHFQPKALIRTGQIVSAEALVRWEHPDFGRIAPNDFIPLAEQSGLIGPLTEWVLNRALKQLRRWKESGREVEIAVNLSSRSLYDDGLPAMVAGALAKWQVDPSQLRLELTETAIMEDPEAAFATLSRIHDTGVKISIDDFGTGYSSLGYLTKLPVDEIKIDRAFVTEMRSRSQNAVIVRSTVELGHSLGLQVVAEGVEDEPTWELLGLLGCDVGQGYFLGRPGPAADLTPRLKRHKRAA